MKNYLGSPPELEAPAGSKTSNYVYVSSIALAAVVGLIFRWRGLSSQSLWWDEGFTLWISQFSVKDICRGLQGDTSPPLFYILEHWWIHWFGISETALRGFSAFFESLSFPIFFLLARDVLVERKAAAMAMWLFVLSPFQIAYAQDARFYGLLSFIALGTLYCTIRLFREWSFLWLSLVVLFVSAGLYTHYMMFFYFSGIAAFWLMYPSDRPPFKRVLGFSLVSATALILFSPWVPTLIRQAKEVHHSFWVSPPGGRALLETFSLLSGIETSYLSTVGHRLLHTNSDWIEWLVLFSALLLLGVCLIGGLVRVLSSSRRRLAALLMYAVLPVLFVFFASRISTPLYINRIFIGSSAVMPILYCAPVAFQSGVRRKLYSLLASALIVIVAISLFGHSRYSMKENWRGLADYSSNVEDGPRLIVFIPYQAQILYDYYANPLTLVNSRAEETGLPVPFDFQNPVRLYTSSFPSSKNFEAFILDNFRSSRYRELDFVMSHTPAEFAGPIVDVLKKRCSRFVEKDFRGIAFLQCTTPSANQSP